MPPLARGVDVMHMPQNHLRLGFRLSTRDIHSVFAREMCCMLIASQMGLIGLLDVSSGCVKIILARTAYV